MNNAAERYDLLVRLNDYTMFKGDFEPNLLEHVAIFEAASASVKRMKKQLIWLQNERRLQEKNREELMRK